MARKQKRRRKKMSISSAVIRFLIGLLLIAIVVFAGFYLLFEVDYSAQLMNSDGTYASTRAYVLPPDGSAATIAPTTPVPTAAPTVQPTATPQAEATEAAAAPEAEATEAAATPEATEAEATSTPAPTQPAIRISTLEPTPSPIPTSSPTATPAATAVPTPTTVPTPEPVGARIPDSAISIYKENMRLPKVYEGGDAEVGLSRCYLSKLNYYQVMQVNGWGYIDDAEFDGHQCTTFALVSNRATGKSRVYLCTSLNGVSGREHQPQNAVNVSDCDFQVTIDTSEFDSGEYEFRIILYYSVNGRMKTWICPFDTARTFSVVDGEIVEGLALDY